MWWETRVTVVLLWQLTWPNNYVIKIGKLMLVYYCYLCDNKIINNRYSTWLSLFINYGNFIHVLYVHCTYKTWIKSLLYFIYFFTQISQFYHRLSSSTIRYQNSHNREFFRRFQVESPYSEVPLFLISVS